MPRHLLIVDDDPLSREIFILLAGEAGFTAEAVDSGEAALAHLALNPAPTLSAMLVDFQMPGLSGDPLALRLRPACGAATVLVAMSGSPVAPASRTHFDTFLLKPFTFDALLAVLAGAPTHPQSEPATTPADILSQATYAALAQSMSHAQIHSLYQMCLDDAARRLVLMRRAVLEGDADTYCRAAHAIKGGCGMVGALELASIASAMEQDGPPRTGEATVDKFDPFQQFEAAATRLRSMLEAQP